MNDLYLNLPFILKTISEPYLKTRLVNEKEERAKGYDVTPTVFGYGQVIVVAGNKTKTLFNHKMVTWTWESTNGLMQVTVFEGYYNIEYVRGF